jgi:hypothetical protein
MPTLVYGNPLCVPGHDWEKGLPTITASVERVADRLEWGSI